MIVSSCNANPLRTCISATLLAACALSAGHAAAGNLVLGLGSSYNAAEYEGVDSELSVTPVINYEVGRFSIEFGSASFRLASFSSAPVTDPDTRNQESNYNLQLLASGILAFDERDNDDSPVFADMETRDYGSIAGISAILETPFGLFSASHLADVSGASNGALTSLAYGIPLYSTPRLGVFGNIGVNSFDESWNDYYYGVRESEATNTRASYRAGRSVTQFVELSASYVFNPHWAVSQGVTVTQLDDTVIDSPLTVDDDTHAEYALNVLYIF